MLMTVYFVSSLSLQEDTMTTTESPPNQVTVREKEREKYKALAHRPTSFDQMRDGEHVRVGCRWEC